MKMVVRSTKVVKRGVRLVDVVKLSAFNYEELPKAYTDLSSAVWSSYNGCRVSIVRRGAHASIPVLKEGETYSAEEFEKASSFLMSAGKVLSEIKKQIEKDNMGWYGETATIY